MADGPQLNYGQMMQRALRGMMAEALGHVAEHGLPGEHHFYISIDTTHPGVVVPDWLRERHPREITIVLQHEFEDLAVLSDRFQVRLSFSNTFETLVVPFAAVKTFIDPSVELALKFEGVDDAADEDEGTEFTVADPEAPDEPDPDNGGPSGGSADVVSLDQFRKP
ncbi:MAG: ClpXP protease specificity-enhancing factor SspB [Pseudomonadota bacterium]